MFEPVSKPAGWDSALVLDRRRGVLGEHGGETIGADIALRLEAELNATPTPSPPVRAAAEFPSPDVIEALRCILGYLSGPPAAGEAHGFGVSDGMGLWGTAVGGVAALLGKEAGALGIDGQEHGPQRLVTGGPPLPTGVGALWWLFVDAVQAE